ncbi:hypothetical protein pb186bvf_012437 [Paramecium bursaria]
MFLSLLFGIALASKEENDLQIVFDKNLQNFLKKYEISVVYFYTPQCGHCEKFQPDVEKAAKYFKDEDIPFAKVDGHTYKDISKRFEVNGFPSLLYLYDHGQKQVKFEGSRTSEAVILFVYEQINPGSQEISSLDDIKKEIEVNDLLFLYISNDKEDRGYRRFIDYSHLYGGLRFIHTFEPIQKDLGLQEFDQLIAYKKYDKSPIIYPPKQLKVNELKAFIEVNSIPKLSNWNADYKKKAFKQDKQAIVLVLDGKSEIKDKNAIDAVYPVAVDYPYEEFILFLKVTPESELYEEFLGYIGDVELPALFALKQNALQKFKMNRAITKSNVEQFVLDFKNSKATRFYKSQNSQPDYSKNVQQLTGLQYPYIKTPKNDYVILYYNGLESEHKDVITSFDKVASALGPISTIKFAITDASKNEFPDFDESIDIVKIRLYSNNQVHKFALKANKLQPDRLKQFVMEKSSFEFVEQNKHDDL